MNVQVIKNRIRKTLAYGITTILFILISGVLILQIPPVQEALISRYLDRFSMATGFPSHVTGFNLLWFDRLELQGVSVFDPDSNKMIAAKKILINFKLMQLLEENNVHIDGIFLDSAEVYLTKIAESDTSQDLNINIFIKEINNLSSGNGTGKPPQINIGEAVLSQCGFTYVDQYRDTVPVGFDYNHFAVSVDEGQLQNFMVLGDTVEFDVRTLIAQDKKTNFRIRQLSTFFRISQQSMEFAGLNLQAGESVVTDTVVFTYQSQRDLSEFISKINIHANLNNTTVHPNDLALFAPGAAKLGQLIKVDGIVDGKVQKFTLKNMSIGIGNTLLEGTLDMDGLPDFNETFIILNLKNSRIDFNDLAFLYNEKTLERLEPIGALTMNGQFLGYPTDFVANGDFSGKLGRIRSDINVKVNENDIDHSTYTGKLALIDFDLGTYLNDTILFQKVNLDGKVSGSGLTLQTANFTLDGVVNSLGINGYNYTNIVTNARFASSFFNGFLKINDPNLEFNAQGSIDLREGRNHIKILASLDTAFLHNLNISKKNIFLQTKLDVDIQGLQLDSLIGQADFKNFNINYGNEWLHLDTIHLRSSKEGKMRVVDMETSLLDIDVQGDFLFSNIYEDLQTLANEIYLNVKNDKLEIETYYANKARKPSSYETDFNLTIKDIRPLSSLLELDLDFAENTMIEGKFTSGYTTIFQAFATFDSLRYQENTLLNTEIELTASKIADSTSVLAMAYVNSQKQNLGKSLQTKNLVAEGIWNKSHIDFSLDCDQEGQNNYVRLEGAVDFLKDSTKLKLLPSTIKLLERDWLVEPGNQILVKGNEWDFRNLKVMNDDQMVEIEGFLSEDPSKILSVTVTDLDLSILNVISPNKFKGTLNAEINFRSYIHDPSVENDILIDSLTVDDFLVGDITGKNHWDAEEKKFNINFFIDRLNSRIVNFSGFYNPSDIRSPLALTATLEDANLKIVEPFLDEIFSRIDGTISGTYQITGKLDDPAIRGEGLVNNGQLMVNYLKTTYRFTGTIGFTPESIFFRNIELNDAFKNKANLNGAITHQRFRNMRINLDGNFNAFQVLNTSAKDNSLFYGQGYATGSVNFFGPLANLKITSTARTEKSTRIYIPMGSSSVVEKEDFINFVSFSDSSYIQALRHKIESKIDLTGVTLDFNLDVTPDAYCEIIFDIKAGDIIRGRGNGDLRFQLDTKGEFNMFGLFEFTEGWYNFTLYDIINKEFEIQRGSRITWFGDPYAGNLNITASYNQLASLGPIFTDSKIANSPQMARKYPVQVILKLDGPMRASQINFDIIANDLPQNIVVEGQPVQLDFRFNAFRNSLDEQELKRQVFSLVILRRFSPPESFNTSGSVVSSVSELLSNQLSYWLSQVDENLEIDVDVATMDQEAFNTFQLRLSYTFLNGRLRVTRDGTFNNQYSNSQNNLSSIAGDWTVDYLLTADGKLKVKMYNRTNVNPITNSLGTQSAVTTGVSLQLTQSFNEIKDLLRFSRDKNKKSRKDDSELNEEATKEEDGSQ